MHNAPNPADTGIPEAASHSAPVNGTQTESPLAATDDSQTSTTHQNPTDSSGAHARGQTQMVCTQRKRALSESPGDQQRIQPSKNFKECKVRFYGAIQKKDWALNTIQQSAVVIGDQNCEFIQPPPNTEVHCLPGFMLEHLKNILKLEEPNNHVKQVILWAGHNELHRGNYDLSIARHWKTSLTNAHKSFPSATIWAAQVLTPAGTTHTRQTNCAQSNQLLRISHNVKFVRLDSIRTEFKQDNISLSRQSAGKAFNLLIKHITTAKKN
jgi:hypothetical protein